MKPFVYSAIAALALAFLPACASTSATKKACCAKTKTTACCAKDKDKAKACCKKAPATSNVTKPTAGSN